MGDAVRRRFSNKTIFALWMRRSGVPALEVCERLGISTPHYLYIITGRAARKLGVRLRQTEISTLSVIDGHGDEIMASLLSGESVSDIALRIGVSHEGIRQWMQRQMNVSTAR